MKISLIVLAVACLNSVGAHDCPENCKCSDGISSVARCNQLNSQMYFPGRVAHLVIESVTDLQINLTKSFFNDIGLQQVSTIKIANCSISYIDVDAFENLQQLTDVNLSYNGLILIHPDTFWRNNQLERLSLRGNPLQLTQLLTAEENYFLKSSSLSELDLSRCQLSSVSKRLLAQVPSLQYINLSSNNIKVIDDYIFENVPLLDEIDLSFNMLTSLNVAVFEDVEDLTTLYLRSNLIENIDNLNIPALKELDVSHNNIKDLNKNMFEGIPDLSTLNISYNGIKVISEETFENLLELKNLDLSYNALMGPLARFIFEKNEYLETLSLAGNEELRMFDGFSTEMPKLYQLDISGCGLSNLSNSSFRGMPSLAILNISSNTLSSLNHVIMTKTHRLNVLDASYNNITKIGTYTFTSNSHLRKLNLSHNKIHHLSPYTFNTTTYLTHLDISHNFLSHIWHKNDSEYMKNNSILSQLEYLNIAENNIRILNKHNFGHLIQLKSIKILGNPLECTSEFPSFIEWLYSNHIQPLSYEGKSAQLEEKLEKSNLQWDDLLMEVCKPQTERIEFKTKPLQSKEAEIKNRHDLNIYHYTVIEDVKLTEAKMNIDTHVSSTSSEKKDNMAEEITTYVWPTFLVIFTIAFLMLAIGNTIALLIYRSRNLYSTESTAGLKTAFITPLKRTIVKVDTTPRYHKLYEECSVPNTPIVKNNIFGAAAAVLMKSKNDNAV